MTLDWFLSAIAVSHIVGTLTFFFTSLANLAIYNGEYSENMSGKYVFRLLLHSNKWLIVWHQGLKLHIWGYNVEEHDDE